MHRYDDLAYASTSTLCLQLSLDIGYQILPLDSLTLGRTSLLAQLPSNLGGIRLDLARAENDSERCLVLVTSVELSSWLGLELVHELGLVHDGGDKQTSHSMNKVDDSP